MENCKWMLVTPLEAAQMENGKLKLLGLKMAKWGRAGVRKQGGGAAREIGPAHCNKKCFKDGEQKM
jgi:hypothetical protein